jgi:hypothetical protein
MLFHHPSWQALGPDIPLNHAFRTRLSAGTCRHDHALIRNRPLERVQLGRVFRRESILGRLCRQTAPNTVPGFMAVGVEDFRAVEAAAL